MTTITYQDKMRLVMQYSDNVLSIIDHSNDMTRSDLQGAIEAQLSVLISKVTTLKK